MQDNIQKVVDGIYNIERAKFPQLKEWYEENKTRWDLTDTISLTKSEDLLSWILWKNVPEQTRKFYKVVPRGYLTKEQVKTIINAQPWICV